MNDLYNAITVSVEGRFATVTLARPEKRNSLSIDTMLELTDAFRRIARGDAPFASIDGVILAAEGPVFSAGHNFGDMAGADVDTTQDVFEVCTEMMDTIQAVPQPVIARVHALATAAGCQLVATCDLAIAAESASFAIPGGKGGLFCHTPLVAVARNIGRKRALEMAMTGDPIFDEAVLDLITRATRGSADSKARGKHAFYAQIDLPQDEAYQYAVEVMAEAAASPDAQEGIDAFLNKRHPNFTQRPGGAS